MGLHELGMKMKAFRKENGYTQEDLAKLLGITTQSVSSYETGRSKPNMATLIEFSIISGISIDELTSIEESLNKINEPDVNLANILSSFRSISVSNFLKKPENQRESILKDIADTINNNIDKKTY